MTGNGLLCGGKMTYSLDTTGLYNLIIFGLIFVPMFSTIFVLMGNGMNLKAILLVLCIWCTGLFSMYITPALPMNIIMVTVSVLGLVVAIIV